jgi:recombinational DNA repair ATPase RecF
MGVTQPENELLNTSQIDQLLTLVEEATRATKGPPKRFIEPARGTLDRAKSRRHHIVFGRRGSGKTSLLRKASSDLTLLRIPVAFIDLEAFKGHAYPDVLLSILIETLHAFDEWLGTAGINATTNKRWWEKLWGGEPERPPLEKKKLEQVRKHLQAEKELLTRLLHSDDNAELIEHTGESKQTTSRSLSSTFVKASASANVPGAKADIGADAKSEDEQTGAGERKVELTETTKRNKLDILHRRIINFQKLFDAIVELSTGDAFIFLDDLYHLRRADQPQVLDYFHRIVKGRSAWLKIGTIRHRTDWYHHGDPPVGMKLSDDCDDIDLDITLAKFGIARKFLLQVLNQIIKEADLKSHEVILVEGGVVRLVLASGGVARDFLSIFRKAVEVARERGRTYRGERVNAEDVNVAAGEHEPSKRDELRRDTLEERRVLEKALLQIREFCVTNEVNCFLVEQDAALSGHLDVLGELADLRFVHIVNSRTTARDRPGKLFTAYMLDISQYTGERTRRDLEMISFWKRSELDKIRRSKFVYPIDAVDQLLESETMTNIAVDHSE